MAKRGRKSLTPEEKLIRINDEIEECTERVNYLKEEKSKLEEELKQKQLNNLYDIILSSGKSIEDVKLMLV